MGERSVWLYRELLAAGKTKHEIQAEVKNGTLFRVSPGLYTRREPDDLLTLQALTHARPDLVFTGPAAAYVYGFGGRPDLSWPVTARMPRSRSRDGGRFVQVTPSQVAHARLVDGVRVTAPLETAVTLAGSTGVHRRRTTEFLQRAYTGAKGNDVLAEDLAGLPRDTVSRRPTCSTGS